MLFQGGRLAALFRRGNFLLLELAQQCLFLLLQSRRLLPAILQCLPSFCRLLCLLFQQNTQLFNVPLPGKQAELFFLHTAARHHAARVHDISLQRYNPKRISRPPRQNDGVVHILDDGRARQQKLYRPLGLSLGTDRLVRHQDDFRAQRLLFFGI